jgi:lipopolysaccharide transport system permease protein
MIIEAGRAEQQYWRDLWHYRELFCFLAWRDLLVRYKQTSVGVLWALLRPLLTTFVATVVFGFLARSAEDAKLSSGKSPYPILVLAAALPWQLFSSALMESSGSLVGNANLISKVYFPRLVVPASAVIASMVDFLISAILLGLVMLWYHFDPAYRYAPTWRLLALPVFAFLAVAASAGAGLWMSSLTVKYRDFRFLVPLIVQYGFFISPVGYSSEKVSARLGEGARVVYSLNPMAGIIDGFRWSVLGTNEVDGRSFIVSISVVVFLVVTGIWYFRRTERSFADVI